MSARRGGCASAPYYRMNYEVNAHHMITCAASGTFSRELPGRTREAVYLLAKYFLQPGLIRR